jgi:hypothetical protein
MPLFPGRVVNFGPFTVTQQVLEPQECTSYDYPLPVMAGLSPNRSLLRCCQPEASTTRAYLGLPSTRKASTV